ncbi:MAG: hypothetical protein AAGA36_00355 [Pseudomonadota bacterium]
MAKKGHNAGTPFDNEHFDDLMQRLVEQREKKASASGTEANIFGQAEKRHGIHFNKDAFKIAMKIENMKDEEKRHDTMRSLAKLIEMRGWETEYADMIDEAEAELEDA